MRKKKTWLDQAAESGDWKSAEEVGRRKLQKSFGRIGKGSKTFDDEVQEHVDDSYTEDADQLPSDEEEGLLAQRNTRPVVRFERAYQDYRERGGNRALDDRVLEYFAPMDVEEIDRPTIIAGARKLYPKLNQADRASLVHDPLAEILGGIRVSNSKRRTVKRRRIPLGGRLIDHHGVQRSEKEQFELKRFFAEKHWYVEQLVAYGLTVERANRVDGYFGEPDWVQIERHDDLARPPSDTWAQVRKSRKPGPPPDLPPEVLKRILVRPADRWRYKHRGFLSALDRPDGRRLSFGHPPRAGQSRANPYYGYLPQLGRPPKPDKLTNAEKQRTYRARKRRS